jgi:hypothetical protein
MTNDWWKNEIPNNISEINLVTILFKNIDIKSYIYKVYYRSQINTTRTKRECAGDVYIWSLWA